MYSEILKQGLAKICVDKKGVLTEFQKVISTINNEIKSTIGIELEISDDGHGIANSKRVFMYAIKVKHSSGVSRKLIAKVATVKNKFPVIVNYGDVEFQIDNYQELPGLFKEMLSNDAVLIAIHKIIEN